MSHFPTDDELREVFDDYSMGDGSLDREEFKRMCYKYYIAPTYKDVDEVFKELDKNSDEKLTFDEVKNYIAANWKPILDSQNQFLEDLQSCRKKDGPITRDELREILQQPGEEALTDEDIDEIFQLIDLNDDNEISVDEISKLLFNIEAVSRAVSRCESRRSRGRKKSRSRSRSSSKGRKRSKSRSKSRDRRRSKSRSKSRDRKRSKSCSKSRDRKRSRSNERKRSGSRGRKRSSSRGSRHSGSAGSRRGGSGHGRGYEISQGVVSGEAETVSEVIVQNAEAPEQSNQEQTEEQKPETNEQSNVNNEQSNQEQVEAQNPETTEQSNVNNEQSNQEAESGNDKKDDTTEQNDAQQTEEKKPEKTEDNSEQKAE